MTFPLPSTDILFYPLADSIVLCRLTLDCCWFGGHCAIELFSCSVLILNPNVVSLCGSFHDQKMFVQDLCCCSVILPSSSRLSHTRQKTSNLSNRVMVESILIAVCPTTLKTCALFFNIRSETPQCSNQLLPHILLLALLMQDQNIHQLNAHGCHHHCRKDRELCYALGGFWLLKRIMNAMRIAMQTCMVAGWINIRQTHKHH